MPGIGAAYEFKNTEYNLLSYVTAEGLEVAGLQEEEEFAVGLKVKEYGYGRVQHEKL